jgi:hypothetical protein
VNITMNPSESDPSLSRTLAEWRIAPEADPNFRPAVWQRIRAKTQETWTAYVRTHFVGWTVTATLAVVIAGWAGHSVAQAKLDASREKMVISYLVELDPRVMARAPH